MPIKDVHGKNFSYDLNPEPLEQGRLTAIFIHGSGGDRLDWKYQLNGLNKIVNALSVDLPGHGNSDGPPDKSIEASAKSVNSLIDALGLDQVALVGCSLGSAIALQCALENRPWLKALGLVGSGGRLKVAPPILEATLNEPKKAAQMVAQWALSPSADESLSRDLVTKMESTPDGLLHNDLSACNEFDVMDSIGNGFKTVPTWIIVGEDDKLTPVKYSKFLNEKIIDSRLDIIPDSGHLVMIEKPTEFNRSFEAFLKDSGLI